MELTELVQLVGSLGFPIAACVYMMVINNKTVKENTEATNKMVHLMETILARLTSGGHIE